MCLTEEVWKISVSSRHYLVFSLILHSLSFILGCSLHWLWFFFKYEFQLAQNRNSETNNNVCVAKFLIIGNKYKRKKQIYIQKHYLSVKDCIINRKFKGGLFFYTLVLSSHATTWNNNIMIFCWLSVITNWKYESAPLSV